jgi:thermitase
MLIAGLLVASAAFGEEFASDRILVKFVPGTAAQARASVHRAQGGSVTRTIPRIDVDVVNVGRGNVLARIDAYTRNPNVEYAEPDYAGIALQTAPPSFRPSDYWFVKGDQWGMDSDLKTQVPQAWAISRGSYDVKIAILDTGIDQDHEDFAFQDSGGIWHSKLVHNQNFTDSSTHDDLDSHGTHVAGIAGAVTDNYGIGVAGVGFNCSLMNIKVMTANQSGYVSWYAGGIEYSATNGAKVISMSLGVTSASKTLQDAVNYAWSKGCVLVAAAGNSPYNFGAKLYPAAYDKVIAVAATTTNDRKASWSNYGSWVDVSAPGETIMSTLPNHPNNSGSTGYGWKSGTSMATPFVAGLAGLIFAARPGVSNATVRSLIENGCDKVDYDSRTGLYAGSTFGRVNAYKALR